MNFRSTDFLTTAVFTAHIVCGLDFLFTMSKDLGAPCKVSTLGINLARDCHHHDVLRVPRISGVHLQGFPSKAQIVKVRCVYLFRHPRIFFF